MWQQFILERSLIPSVWELAPERRLIADSYRGEPLVCPGGSWTRRSPRINRGVYFGFAGLYYVSPNGHLAKVSTNPSRCGPQSR